MPNNIEGRGLTDREMVHLCLELEKGRCASLASVLFDTFHPSLSEVYEELLGNTRQNQQELVQHMSEKGWLHVQKAALSDLSTMQQQIQHNLHPND